MSGAIFPRLILCLIAPCCTAQSLVGLFLGPGGGSVSNAAGSTALGPNVVAPGMLAAISDFSSLTIHLVWFVLPAPSAHVFVRPFATAVPVPAVVTATQVGRIVFVVPPGIPLGTAELAWQFDNAPYHSIDVSVVKSNFALSGGGEWTGAGPFGPLVTPNGLTTPAKPGQTLVLSGTGLGLETMVGATLGGIPATVTYAGRDVNHAGYEQIQLQVPVGVPYGCYVPLSLAVGSAVATSTISVTSDGLPCSHPFQLPATDMKALDNGDSLTTAQIALGTSLNASLSSAASRQESANLNVSGKTASDLKSYAAPAAGPALCVASPIQTDFTTFGFNLLPQTSFPSFGSSITIASPASALDLRSGNGSDFSAIIPRPQDGTLTNPPLPVIVGGKWTWSFAGSADVAPFSFAFTLPEPLQLNAGAPFSVRRDLDQTITWNGAGFDASTLITTSLNGHRKDGSGSLTVSCSGPAQPGTITIPGSMLSGFAAASIGSLQAQVNLTGPGLPHALLKDRTGATILVVLSWSSGDSRPVDFQ